jgi:hypothetical protein
MKASFRSTKSTLPMQQGFRCCTPTGSSRSCASSVRHQNSEMEIVSRERLRALAAFDAGYLDPSESLSRWDVHIEKGTGTRQALLFSSTW